MIYLGLDIEMLKKFAVSPETAVSAINTSALSARFPAAAPRELEAIAADIVTASAAVSDLIAHVQLGHWTQGILPRRPKTAPASRAKCATRLSSEDVEMS